jgi:hypothetical protein
MRGDGSPRESRSWFQACIKDRPARRPARFHPPIADPADGRWTLSHGAPAATIWADAVDYLRALSGRNDHPGLQPGGEPRATAAAATARVVF